MIKLRKLEIEMDEIKEELKQMEDTRNVNRIKYEIATLEAQLEEDETMYCNKLVAHRQVCERHEEACRALLGSTKRARRLATLRIAEKLEYERACAEKKKAKSEHLQAVEKMRCTHRRMYRVVQRAQRTVARARK